MLNRERNRIVAEVFLAVEENNNGKDSRKTTTKKKRQDKKKNLCYQGTSVRVQLGTGYTSFTADDNNLILCIVKTQS